MSNPLNVSLHLHPRHVGEVTSGVHEDVIVLTIRDDDGEKVVHIFFYEDAQEVVMDKLIEFLAQGDEENVDGALTPEA